MSDNLTVFGTDYTGVTGIKAHKTSDSSLLAYIRPQGTKTITANGTGIDVSAYATADVAVPEGVFVVTLSWDDEFGEDGGWVPNCTFAEIQAAYGAGREILLELENDEEHAGIGGIGVLDEESQGELGYIEFYVIFWNLTSDDCFRTYYGLDSNEYIGYGVDKMLQAFFEYPTRTYTPTEQQQTEVITYDQNKGYNGIEQVEVTVNAIPSNYVGSGITRRSGSDLTASGNTVSVPAGYYESAASKAVAGGIVNMPSMSVTANPSITIDSSTGLVSSMVSSPTNAIVPSITAGYVGPASFSAGNVAVSGSNTSQLSTQAATTITPTTSQQTAVAAGKYTTGNVVVAPIPSQYIVPTGSQTIQTNGTYDITSKAEVVVDVQGGGGTSLQVATSEATPSSASSSIQFTQLVGEPTSFVIMATTELSTGSPARVAAVVFDGQSLHGQTITNTSNAQVSYDTGFTKSYSNGTLTIIATTSQFQPICYWLDYTYGGGSIETSDVQVGSGATSISFTGLEDEPAMWSCIFKSNFSTSSGYQRVIATCYDQLETFGLSMDSSAKFSESNWTFSYSNGTLTITSNGTNAGGYFHQPGYYQLTYAFDTSGNYQSKTVTPTTSQQVVQADSGYDALKKVTVNAIPSEYIIPTGNIAITSNTGTGQSLDVSQYATATVNVPTGGGDASTDTKTVTASNRPSTLSFTSMKGKPIAFFLKATFTMTSSSTTYYYVDSMRGYLSNNAYSVEGRLFRMGSTRQTENVTNGYSASYSGTTLTLTSSGNRTTSPGCFYNGSYELVYVY